MSGTQMDTQKIQPRQQSLLTKFFVSSNPEHSWQNLFEKEEAERKRKEEEEERIRREQEEEEQRLWEEEQRKKAEQRRIRKELEKKLKEEEDSKRQETYRQKTEGKNIVGRLFLGSRLAAQNYDWLKANNIKFILNVTAETRNYYEDSKVSSSQQEQNASEPLETQESEETIPSNSEELCIKYFRISVADSDEEPIHQHFRSAHQFIQEAFNACQCNNCIPTTLSQSTTDVTANDEKNCPGVLVHCREGMSRSPTIIISYLMIQYNLRLLEAYSHVLQANGLLKINHGFKQQLMDLDQDMFQNASLDFFDKSSRRNNSSSLAETPVISESRKVTQPTEGETPRSPKSPRSARRIRKAEASNSISDADLLDKALDDTSPALSSSTYNSEEQTTEMKLTEDNNFDSKSIEQTEEKTVTTEESVTPSAEENKQSSELAKPEETNIQHMDYQATNSTVDDSESIIVVKKRKKRDFDDAEDNLANQPVKKDDVPAAKEDFEEAQDIQVHAKKTKTEPENDHEKENQDSNIPKKQPAESKAPSTPKKKTTKVPAQGNTLLKYFAN